MILEGKADVVFGSRFPLILTGSFLLACSATRHHVFSNMLTNLNLSDMETGYKISGLRYSIT